MANRNFPQSKLWGFHMLPRTADCSIAIGASGAPTLASTTAGIASVTRLAAGQYQIQMQDNYLHILGLQWSAQAPVSGGAVNMGSLNTGTVYQIVTLGTSTAAQWATAGVPVGVTAAPGVVFKAAGAGAGNGTVKILGVSGITGVELMGSADLMQVQPFNAGSGQYVNFQTLGATYALDSYTPTGTISRGNIPVATGTAGDAVTNNAGTLNSTGGQDLTVDLQTFTGAAATPTGTIAIAAADPANGCTLSLRLFFNDSSVQ